MVNRNKLISGIIVLISAVLIVGVILPSVLKRTKLGLDLQGGIEIVYRVEPFEGEQLDQDLMDSVIESMNKRINSFGISETVINQEGDSLIRIQVPGVEDQSAAREYIGSTAVLSFRDTQDNLLMTSDVLVPGKAKTDIDEFGRNQVVLQISDNTTFGDVTQMLASSSNSQMMIWLDFDESEDSFVTEGNLCGTSESNCISAASVQGRITSSAVITGDFTKEEAKSLANLINSGSLQANLVEEYSTTVGASFGEEALSNSLIAGTIGLILVMIFMMFKYRFAGLVSSVSILVYTLLVFIIFYALGGTLTLPGIAALILGVGMAVDSNVITFERIKDEYRLSNNVSEAFEKGNKKSLVTIFDANITTLIIAIILYIFGQTAIKGFATVLIINILTTFLITVLFTRFVLKLFLSSNYFNDKFNKFIYYKESNNFASKMQKYSFVSKNKLFFSISLIIIIVGVVFGQIKGYNLGIDFTSGTSITSNISEVQSEELASYLEEDFNIIENNYVDDKNISVIRISDTLTEDEVNSVDIYVQSNYESEVMIQKVSPFIGEQLVKNSIYSLAIAAIAMVVYISFRFRGSFAISALVALAHDMLSMIAVFAIFRFTISGDFVDAMRAILVYSINDTIVLFDRIRDNINNEVNIRKPKKSKKKKNKEVSVDSTLINYDDLKEIVNTSVKTTIARSLITSFTTLLPIAALIFFGAREIIEFNMALAIGIIFGTYSSIFIGAQVWLMFNKKGYFFGVKKDGWFSVEDANIDDVF